MTKTRRFSRIYRILNCVELSFENKKDVRVILYQERKKKSAIIKIKTKMSKAQIWGKLGPLLILGRLAVLGSVPELPLFIYIHVCLVPLRAVLSICTPTVFAIFNLGQIYGGD